MRQNLGAVLLAAGRADEAEAVFWEDLKRNPENGWSLFGLVQALKAQGKNDDAALVEARFKKAWKDADVTLTTRADRELEAHAGHPAFRHAPVLSSVRVRGSTPRSGRSAAIHKVPGYVTEGRVAVVEHTLPPRHLAAPLHRHSREDELSIVLEGTARGEARRRRGDRRSRGRMC